MNAINAAVYLNAVFALENRSAECVANAGAAEPATSSGGTSIGVRVESTDEEISSDPNSVHIEAYTSVSIENQQNPAKVAEVLEIFRKRAQKNNFAANIDAGSYRNCGHTVESVDDLAIGSTIVDLLISSVWRPS